MSTDWFDGRIARRSGKTSSFGSLLDPVADKVLVLATLVVLLDQGVFPAWMVAAIVGRELLISGLRLAALERGVVIPARDLGKLKTWSQAIAAVGGGLAAAGVWSDTVSWWLLLVSVALTWVSGFDYARSAPRILRGTPSQLTRARPRVSGAGARGRRRVAGAASSVRRRRPHRLGRRRTSRATRSPSRRSSALKRRRQASKIGCANACWPESSGLVRLRFHAAGRW